MRPSVVVREAESGFTLAEVVIAVAVTAVAFLALAGGLATTLRTLTVQKARTQGNEVATQGIEDLQRYAFTNLASCGVPTDDAGAPQPQAELTDIVITPSGCPTTQGGFQTVAEAKANTGDEPCEAPGTTQKGFARAQYTCKRINTVYTVRRYVAWNDLKTSKRMAVFVTWRDLVGLHTVSQQSSLRSPTTGDIIGVDPPQFIAPSVLGAENPFVGNRNPTTTPVATGGGTISSGISLSAVTELLNGAGDRMLASFTTVSPTGDLVSSSVSLSPSSNLTSRRTTWTGTLPASVGGISYVFPTGSQYLTFTVIRDGDGKSGGVVDTPASTFCPGACPADIPKFVVVSGKVVQSFSNVSIDSSGLLRSTVRFKAETVNAIETDRVTMQLSTKSGPVSLAMQPVTNDTSRPCTATSCFWTVDLTADAGYTFLPGDQTAFFTVSQSFTTRSTGASPSSTFTFVIA